MDGTGTALPVPSRAGKRCPRRFRAPVLDSSSARPGAPDPGSPPRFGGPSLPRASPNRVAPPPAPLPPATLGAGAVPPGPGAPHPAGTHPPLPPPPPPVPAPPLGPGGCWERRAGEPRRSGRRRRGAGGAAGSGAAAGSPRAAGGARCARGCVPGGARAHRPDPRRRPADPMPTAQPPGAATLTFLPPSGPEELPAEPHHASPAPQKSPA